MANEQNLIPLNQRSKSVQREIQEKGRRQNKKNWKEKKTIQNGLNKLLNTPIKKFNNVKSLAQSLGLKENQTLKDLYIFVAALNNLKKAKLEDLETIMRILGEETQYENGNGDVEATLAIIKECAYADRDKQETS